MSTSFAMNHIALNCRNVPAQEKFYAKHFGFKRSRTFNAGKPNEFIMLKLGTVRLELFSADALKVVGVTGGEQLIGFKHLAFDVPDLEASIRALTEDGIKVDPIIDISSIIPGARLVFFRDHEGNIIELMHGYVDES